MTDINKYFIYSVLFLSGLTFSSASNADKAEYHIGVGLMYFDYAEYRDNNEFLDGETGFMPGVVIKRKQSHKRLFTEIVGQLHGNTIQYDGQTQGGTPLKTDSVAIIADAHFKLGMILDDQNEPYIGLGYRYWYRHILNGRDVNGNPVSGLLEEYYWYYSMLGFAAYSDVNENVNVGFDIRYTQMFNAKMDVDFLGYGGYDNTQVNLGNESGLRFALPVKIKKYSLTVTPYYEIIDIGKSNNVTVTSNGIPTTTVIYEPRSETRNVGVEVTWLW